MSNRAKILIGLVAVAVWVGALIAKHFWPDVDISGLVAAASSTLAGLGVYHVGTTGDDKGPPAPPNQSGRALPWLLVVVAVAAVLAGCAGLNVQWFAAASYNTAGTATATLSPGAPAVLK